MANGTVSKRNLSFISAVTHYLLALITWVSATTLAAQNVIGWGDNSHGQLDVPPTATNVIAVAAGAYHSLALRSDGTVVGWGNDGYGASVVPDSATNVVAISAGWYHSVALRADGSVIAWGYNADGECDVPASATNIAAISCGYYCNLALTANGSLLTWGRNTYHYTTIPPGATNIVMITAYGDHALALRQDGAIFWLRLDCCYSPINVPGSFPARTIPAMLSGVRAMSAGAFQHLFLTDSMQLYAAGSTDLLPLPSATNLVNLAGATNYSLLLRADGQVLGWGLGSLTNVPPHATNIIAMSAGPLHCLGATGTGAPPKFLDQHSIAFDTRASVGAPLPFFARAVGGQPLHYLWLADGVPLAAADSPFPRIAAALGTDNVDYQLVVTNDYGSITSAVVRVMVEPVFAWGGNLQGQCRPATNLTNACVIAAGAFHGLALNVDGTVTGWGKNQDGQATPPVSATNVIAIAAGGDHSLAVRADGSIVAWGRDWDGQTDVPTAATDVVAISTGWAHSLALRSDGTTLAWGNNDYGQINLPLLMPKLAAIAAGYYHNLGLRPDGTVVAWGDNSFGQCKVPAGLTGVVAIAGGWGHSLALRADGSVVAWGDNSYGQCNVPLDATNVVAISAGYLQNLALRADGTVLAWGKGFNGSATIPLGLTRAVSIAAGEEFSLALAVSAGPLRISRGPAAALGYAGGQMVLSFNLQGGWPLTLQWYHDGVAIAGATNRSLVLSGVRSSDAGNYTLVATSTSGPVTSDPLSLAVQLAPVINSDGSWQNVRLGTNLCLSPQVLGAQPISYQWQRDGTNLLDGGQISGASSPNLCFAGAQVEDSGNYGLAVLNAYGGATSLVARISVSAIVAWGDDSSGQLEVPMGTADVVAVAAGGEHSLALRRDGSIIAWGDDSYGQCDVPRLPTNAVAIAAGDSHSLALLADGSVAAWGDGSLGQTNVPSFPAHVTTVAAGRAHSVALLANRAVVAWGADNAGQTNVPFPFPPPAYAIAAGGDHSLALLYTTGNVTNWGDISGTNRLATNVVLIAAGSHHALALRKDGLLLAWGHDGFYGEAMIPSFRTNVVGLAGGEDHCLALLADGGVVAWGADYCGQTDVPASASGVLAISAGGFHNLALVTPARATLSAHLRDTGLALDWPGNYTLQSSTNASGPFTDVPGATSPYTNDTRSSTLRFFRLR